MQLQILDELPDKFFDLPAAEIHRAVPEPTLFALPGRSLKRAIFVSTLLHGDETSGLTALQTFLSHQSFPLERPLLLFIGNPQAAKLNQRRLADQPDFNRIWNQGQGPEYKLGQQLLQYLQDQPLFLAMDIHNTTGKNPSYPCVTHLEPYSLNLAQMFGNQIVYFKEPHEVLSAALSEFCPAITIESGQSGDVDGIKKLIKFLKECMQLDEIPKRNITADIFHSVARIKIPQNIDLGLESNMEEPAPLKIREDLDELNFKILNKEVRIGCRNKTDIFFEEWNEKNELKYGEFLSYKENEIFFKAGFMPSMLTTSPSAAKGDCLGYLMQPLTIK